MNLRYLTFPMTVALSLARPTGLPRTSPVSRPDFDKVKKSVLNVSADDCSGRQPQQATGFVWSKPDSVVTALHVVAGCAKLTVKFENSGNPWPATVSRVLKSADLALLTIGGAPSMPAMSESSGPLQTDQDLWTWGFQLGAAAPSERKFHKLEGATKLRDFVSSEVADDIKSSGMPDLDIDIIYVSGLVPGLSGAPILDASGGVVGIGDGGLNGGSVGINWALPQKYLAQLLQSTEDKNSVVGVMNVHQFAFDKALPAGSGASISCGNTIFNRVPDVSLANAVRGTDSPIGLQQLMNIYSVGDPTSVSFSVYQDFNSGATFVLPKAATVASGASGCIANLPGTTITFTIEIRHYIPNNLNDAISERAKFDADVLPQIPAGAWNFDPAFTTPPVTQPRFDDFAARRVSWYRSLPGSPQIGENVFTTTAIKRGTFMGVAAHTPSSYFFNPPGLPPCNQNPSFPGCQEVLQRQRTWGTAVISVHLATFPIG
jgi:hypothetical protein